MRSGFLLRVGLVLALAPAVQAQTIVGTWQGKLPVEENPRMMVRIEQQDGGLRGVYISVDESAFSYPLSAVVFHPPDVSFAMDYADLAFQGRLNADGKTITGIWRMGKESHPLTLALANPDTQWTYTGVSHTPTMAVDADPSFEVATIRRSSPDTPGPYRFSNRTRKWEAHNATVSDLVQFAWMLKPRQIEGGPGWMDTDKFDISAEPDLPGQQSVDQNRVMVRKLLAERFGLKMHMTERVMPVYVLSVQRSAVNMMKSVPNPGNTGTIMPRQNPDGQWKVQWASIVMPDFINILMNFITDRQIVDKTGLTGQYDFSMTLPGSVFEQNKDAEETANAFIQALQSQLGLKLETTRAPVPVLVVDHIEKPSAN